ncbi:MAG: hypothetical protein ABWY05_10770 [Noviherbaspirillum sp.]
MSEKIRSDILLEGKLFPPPQPEPATSRDADYKAAARALIAKAGELIAGTSEGRLHELSRSTVSANLLPALHSLSHAGKVMIIAGRNTAEGKVTIDGPVSAAVTAHVLYES